MSKEEGGETLSSDFTYSSKIDVLDLIINGIREKEKALDELAERLSEALETLSKNKGV